MGKTVENLQKSVHAFNLKKSVQFVNNIMNLQKICNNQNLGIFLAWMRSNYKAVLVQASKNDFRF